MFPLLLYAVDGGVWNGGGVQTAECEDNEDSRVFVGIVMCRVWRSAGCQVQSVKCKA